MLLSSILFSALLGLTLAQKGPDYPRNVFNQTIDHFPDSARYVPHAKGTFHQGFYFDSTYYKKGGPVFLYIGGETNGPSRFSNLQNGIIQILMSHFNGLGVILENRYYGHSHPFENSTVDNLAYLTTEQTIADNANFAKNVKFPGIDEDLTAPNRAWIMYGGSLAGAQTAFTMKTYGDVIWGGIASSGVIKAKIGYPEWYKPIQKYGPQDCITTLHGLIDKIDQLFDSGNREAISEMKTMFGLQSVTDDRDFARAISNPIGNPMFYTLPTWQELNWYPAYSSSDFWHFCSVISDVDPPANNTAADRRLAKFTNGETWKGLGNYAAYIKKIIIPQCESGDLNGPMPCFGSQLPTYWAHTRNSGVRSYLYTSCSEQGAYMVAPETGPSLISRVIKADYTQQWCKWAFPPGKFNSIPDKPQLQFYNKYGGYDFHADRLAFIDGTIDPWLHVCYHAPEAGPRLTSTATHPQLIIAGAGHHWDSYGIKNISAEPDFIKQAHHFELRTVKRWLEEFGERVPSRR